MYLILSIKKVYFSSFSLKHEHFQNQQITEIKKGIHRILGICDEAKLK